MEQWHLKETLSQRELSKGPQFYKCLTEHVWLALQVTKEEMLDAEPLESYVLVRKEDVLEAIGAFVAAYLAELPEAQNLQPAQLQAALKTTFKVQHFSGRHCVSCLPACKHRNLWGCTMLRSSFLALLYAHAPAGCGACAWADLPLG